MDLIILSTSRTTCVHCVSLCYHPRKTSGDSDWRHTLPVNPSASGRALQAMGKSEMMIMLKDCVRFHASIKEASIIPTERTKSVSSRASSRLVMHFRERGVLCLVAYGLYDLAPTSRAAMRIA